MATNGIEYKILNGSALEMLKTLPAESVQCVITSPPYYGLRSYNTEPQVWDGDSACSHQFGEAIRNPKSDPRSPELKASQGASVGTNVSTIHWSNWSLGNFCVRCNAWRGELGLEPDFRLYISHLIQIFAEVKRVLKKDGTCWVNLGDSYNGVGGPGGQDGWAGNDTAAKAVKGGNGRRTGLPSKSLLNIPNRFAIAMTDELQFIQRNTIIWHKPATVPSSAKDRFTVDFEPVFFFAKSAKYKFNQQLEPLAESTKNNYRMVSEAFTNNQLKRDFVGPAGKGSGMLKPSVIGRTAKKGQGNGEQANSARFGHSEVGRNKRTTWRVSFEPSDDEHYAAYPTKLIEPMVLAGTDDGDTVLDPFNGTGTTGFVALQNRRKYIGIELQEKYIAITERRLENIPIKLNF